MKDKVEERRDRKQAVEVNKLYSKLDKKEFAVLMKWISYNCDVAVSNYKEQVEKMIDEVSYSDFPLLELKQKLGEIK